MLENLLTSRRALCVTASLMILPAGAVPFWTFDNGNGDANFGTADNWDSNIVPGQDQGAVINVFSPNVPLLITSDQTVDTLRINDGRTVTQTAGTLTIANAGNQFERGLWIGEFGWNNVYNMQGGSIVIHDDFDGIILGKAGGAQGILNFSGGTITNTAGDTFIGADQEGVWNQTGGTFTGATVYLARWGSPNVEKGFVNLDGGTFAATRVQKGDGNEAFFNFNGGTLQARASVTDFFHSMTRANVRNGGAIIDTNGFNVTVSQALLHSDIGGDAAIDGGLRKTGTGTLTLTGASTYTGETNIDAGTLVVNGTLGGNGAVNVAAGATLGGIGSIGGNTTISGIHTPGNSPGLQSFGGNLAYAGSAAGFVWDLNFTTGDTGTPLNGGDAYDQVDVAGTLTGTGDATFRIALGGGDFSDAFWSVNRAWDDVFTASNAFALGDIFGAIAFEDGLDPEGYGSFSFSGSTLQWTAVPEPHAALIGSFGLLWLLRRRR